MRIIVHVVGKSSEFESSNDIRQDVFLDELDIIKLACNEIKNKYPCGVIDEDNSSIDKIEL